MPRGGAEQSAPPHWQLREIADGVRYFATRVGRIMGELTLNRAHDGRIVEVKFGDRVTVRLPETPATGFRWALDEAGSNVLQLETERNELASGTGVGGGGHRVFVFRSSK